MHTIIWMSVVLSSAHLVTYTAVRMLCQYQAGQLTTQSGFHTLTSRPCGIEGMDATLLWDQLAQNQLRCGELTAFDNSGRSFRLVEDYQYFVIHSDSNLA